MRQILYMRKYFLVWIFMLIALIACNNNEESSAVNQADIRSPNSKDTIDINAASVKADEYYDNFEHAFDTLIGCWSAIREGNITISFSKDSTFEFFDYNSKLKENELLTGRFELNDNILILFYNDRPKQRFTFRRDPESKNEYRITNSSGYYFLKSHCL